jgi:AraC-like DNA-binding protein
MDRTISFAMTKYHSSYGYVKVENSDYQIVIGPINDFPYTNEVLLGMSKEFSFGQIDYEMFSTFFHNIPTHNLYNFLNILLFINYNINNSELTMKDIIDYEGALIDSSINQKYSDETYEAKEEGVSQNNYSIESELLHYIETGNMKELQQFSERAKNTIVGIIANDSLRQLKNTFVVTATLASRAAMKGGLSPSIAYKLSDVYLKQVERLTDADTILSLTAQVLRDYTSRVANSIAPVVADNIIYQVIQYVRENTNQRLTVANIAEHVGFSRPYLSRKVKKELGFDLSQFIMRCKLEEGKDLLAFSDKSISQISNYLCFSSQGHFQRAFKGKYGMTPQFYRKSVVTSKSPKR